MYKYIIKQKKVNFFCVQLFGKPCAFNLRLSKRIFFNREVQTRSTNRQSFQAKVAPPQISVSPQLLQLCRQRRRHRHRRHCGRRVASLCCLRKFCNFLNNSVTYLHHLLIYVLLFTRLLAQFALIDCQLISRIVFIYTN